MRAVQSNHRSQAFTLVELLVVIAIIAALAALSFVAYQSIFGRSYQRNTNAGIEHLYGVLKKQWAHVIAEAKKEGPPSFIKEFVADDPTGERAKVVWIMLRLAEAFPQSYDEIQQYGNSATSPIVTAGAQQRYAPMYRSKIGTLKSGANPQAESAACLYLALTTVKGGHTVNPDQLPVKPLDTDGDGTTEFCDSWQKPLAFFRFPYANAKLAGKAPVMSGPKGPYLNPLDPSKILQPLWAVALRRSGFEDSVRFEIGNWYTTPVIVSAGADNLLGLQFKNASRGFPDMLILPLAGGGDQDGNNTLDANDNLYSFDIVAP